MTNEGEVYFMLYGQGFDPEEATRLIGIEPTSIRRKADPRPKYSSWAVSTGKIEGDVIDVYELSSALVSKLRPYTEKIASVKRQLKLEAVLEVVLRITTDDSVSTPAIGFDSEVILFLNSIGATIDVDTYRNVA